MAFAPKLGSRSARIGSEGLIPIKNNSGDNFNYLYELSPGNEDCYK
jgi:hypothetical protein